MTDANLKEKFIFDKKYNNFNIFFVAKHRMCLKFHFFRAKIY